MKSFVLNYFARDLNYFDLSVSELSRLIVILHSSSWK